MRTLQIILGLIICFLPIFIFEILRTNILYISIYVILLFIVLRTIGKAAIKGKVTKENIQPENIAPFVVDDMYKLYGIDTLQIHIGTDLIKFADYELGDAPLMNEMKRMRDIVFFQNGIIIPPIHVCDYSADLKPTEYKILLRGNTVFTGEVLLDHYLIEEKVLKNFIKAHPSTIDEEILLGPIQNLFEKKWFWVEAKLIDSLIHEQKWTAELLLNPGQVIVGELAFVVSENIELIFLKEDVQKILEQVRIQNPRLADLFLENRKYLSLLRDVLINLFNRKISIRDIHLILDNLEDLALTGNTDDSSVLADKLAILLKRECKHKNDSENLTHYVDYVFNILTRRC